MVGSINDDSNTNAIIRNLARANAEKTKSFARLSSGRRINSAADDAAGLAIAESLVADVRTSLQGARNAADGLSGIAIANSTAAQISDIRTRQAELAAQASNGSLTDIQRQALDNEFQQLDQEASRIVESTKFNGVNVFSSTGEQTVLQVGLDGSESSKIAVDKIDPSSSGGFNLLTQASAQAALDGTNVEIDRLAAERGALGGAESRVIIAENRARDNAVELEAAASRIRDADVATEVANLVRSQVKEQANIALLAQANQNKSRVLALLS